MPTARDLSHEFSPDVRARGEAYWRQGRVRVVQADDARLVAQVRGTEAYQATIAREPGGPVTLDCTCPYADEHAAPCKHLWATVLEAASRGSPLVGGTSAPRHAAGTAPSSMPHWRVALRRVAAASGAGSPWTSADPGAAEWPAGRRIAYLVDVPASVDPGQALVVELATQAVARDGSWSAPKRFAYTPAQWLAVPDDDDREIAQMLLGAREGAAYLHDDDLDGRALGTRPFELTPAAHGTTLRRLCETGRCFVRLSSIMEPVPLVWDDGPPWTLELSLVARGADRVRVAGALVRHEDDAAADAAERLPLEAPALVARGLVLIRDAPPARGRRILTADGLASPVRAARCTLHGAEALAVALRGGHVFEAPRDDAALVATELATLHPGLPPVALPPEIGVRVVRVAPRPVLALGAAPGRVRRGAGRRGAPPAEPLTATLAFDYDGARVAADEPGTVLGVGEEDGADGPPRRLIYRDAGAEGAARARLERGGARRDPLAGAVLGPTAWRLPRERATALASALVGEGWLVTLEARAVRTARAARLRVRSGVDWFDLEGALDFDGVPATLPALLAALARGERTLTLADGSLGVIGEAWAARYASLAALVAARPPNGAGDADHVRFGPGQALLLDAWLDADALALDGDAGDPGDGVAGDVAVEVDERFARAREALHAVAELGPCDAPAGFGTTLRPYQRVGLGWLQGLQRLGLGGVLADDMGLGKTVQVLALLEARRQAGAGPSLVVVPRSLVHNWVEEATRLAPAMRVHVHHGTRRAARTVALREADLVLTTYGTLRRDASDFREIEFDHAVLDEAQAIKNAATSTARAARLVRARHRLVMTGTPIENRLEDLWSLFEFLNPGMLGAAPAFARLVRAGREGERSLVARGVRPLLLRRTKAQVAPELPARTEQTVWVELAPEERRLYDELRDHYRASLLARVERDGMGASRMHVLEALLRLRQAACHPGLVDRARAGAASSKLDVLADRLGEVVAEGHKALVFSQFTTLLGIVRARLDADGVPYEYLDGRTRDRQRRILRFQEDPAVPVFLVSLKAGGVGLNLTAADHVFLLDPWWNPAVEAQAIDRAHRIGQDRPVLAQRLVARDTVEEKVLALQHGKRELAEAIVRADAGVVGRLSVEELRELLG